MSTHEWTVYDGLHVTADVGIAGTLITLRKSRPVEDAICDWTMTCIELNIPAKAFSQMTVEEAQQAAIMYVSFETGRLLATTQRLARELMQRD